ncbi:MAG TPA: hypothetical protein PLH97_12860 [Verrucomicrobiota bacterium]|nr:hypothetical protein [Verrucomicrobiota bacterium]
MISIELMGNSARLLEAEFVKQASQAVFHYFRTELGRVTVTVAEFASALERVLRSFGYRVRSADCPDEKETGVSEFDLRQLASESVGGCELFFFPRLREQLRRHLENDSRIVRFHGLRGCVKQLAGARRWSGRCESLQNRILEFLRECLSIEAGQTDCSLLVD